MIHFIYSIDSREPIGIFRLFNQSFKNISTLISVILNELGMFLLDVSFTTEIGTDDGQQIQPFVKADVR